ncbi:DUF4249 domain-containing protein [Mucilaginibacter myungsuensis]|uniref:DUF4249 domain-containing protein n=1 Tax=Mucilaginibacter myungsuensis TaxID=649104 RepID=A0A929KY94_9SPHI|nr:DUF4249 domain-containing protein [Mucilaginibacter myungsuensis]MBE9662668.1 DUF4249 domain-containing protein [Mucilaginibacter myungsuensis]MDN3598088.1 DUF4249 domain-containing protein [Mucilaginibacter myungsuensis]
MKTLKQYILLILALPILASCQKVIDLDLGNDTGKLVIEANFTNVIGTQTVKITRNVPFTQTNTYPPVKGAKVVMTNAIGDTRTFTETADGVYTANIGGLVRETYKLTVETDSKVYTASSHIPDQVFLDSITTRPAIFDADKGKKTLSVHYLDPGNLVNQYRFIIWKNNVQVKTVYAYNDDFNNGRYVSLDLRVRDDADDDFGIYAGDTVKVEMQCIDKPVYLYWYTLMRQSSNGPGGGVSPADPPTNFSPTALGYFSAHTTQSKTIVVKP